MPQVYADPEVKRLIAEVKGLEKEMEMTQKEMEALQRKGLDKAKKAAAKPRRGKEGMRLASARRKHVPQREVILNLGGEKNVSTG